MRMTVRTIMTLGTTTMMVIGTVMSAFASDAPITILDKSQ